jgi:DNA-binding protein YbaB
MALTPDAAAAVIGELTRRIEALRAGRYEGRDKDGLATVKVDGDGLVCDVTLSKSISRHRSVVVAKAVREALLAAQMSMTQAYEALAAEAEKLAAGEGDG